MVEALEERQLFSGENPLCPPPRQHLPQPVIVVVLVNPPHPGPGPVY
jgi:hypothetical protein